MPCIFVGIDVAKANLDVHILPSDRKLTFPNDLEGHRKLVESLLISTPKPNDVRVVLESTGGYELAVAIALEEAGIQTAIIKPERARFFAKAMGHLAKTDTIDARNLALFCQKMDLEIRPLPAEEIRHFRDLLDRRQNLVDMQTMEKNRKRQGMAPKATNSLEQHIDWLVREIKKIEQEIDKRIEKHPNWSLLDTIIQSVPGVGAQTSRVLIGQLPELGQMDTKSLASLVGIAPMNNDSGTVQGERHIVGGRKDVRRALYMAALASTRHNPVFIAMYAKLVSKGKPGKVALIAVAHKLLKVLNAMVTKKTTWRHSIVAKNA